MALQNRPHHWLREARRLQGGIALNHPRPGCGIGKRSTHVQVEEPPHRILTDRRGHAHGGAGAKRDAARLEDPLHNIRRQVIQPSDGQLPRDRRRWFLLEDGAKRAPDRRDDRGHVEVRTNLVGGRRPNRYPLLLEELLDHLLRHLIRAHLRQPLDERAVRLRIVQGWIHVSRHDRGDLRMAELRRHCFGHVERHWLASRHKYLLHARAARLVIAHRDEVVREEPKDPKDAGIFLQVPLDQLLHRAQLIRRESRQDIETITALHGPGQIRRQPPVHQQFPARRQPSF